MVFEKREVLERNTRIITIKRNPSLFTMWLIAQTKK